jgi:hypothetical protein
MIIHWFMLHYFSYKYYNYMCDMIIISSGVCLCCIRRMRNRLTLWWRRWQALWEASLWSNTLEVGSWRERGGGDIWSLRTRSFLWIFPGVDAGDGGGARSCLFFQRCTSLVVLWHLCLVVASVYIIVVRLFAGLWWINKIKEDRMHLFDADAGLSHFEKEKKNDHYFIHAPLISYECLAMTSANL